MDPKGGKLIVNEDESGQVRGMYQLYLEHKALIPVVEEIQRRGWKNKQWTTSTRTRSKPRWSNTSES